MKTFRSLSIWVGVLAMLSVGSLRAEVWESGKGDHLAYCAFGPRLRVFAPDAAKKGKCEGEVKVQALMWDCNSPDRVADRVTEFRNKLMGLATKECQKYCSNLAKNCTGKFSVPLHCGLESDQEEAIAAGKKFGCRSDCKGQALIFCSIYDAGYRLDDPVLLAKAAPNCKCVPK